jgi:hypothetical protein
MRGRCFLPDFVQFFRIGSELGHPFFKRGHRGVGLDFLETPGGAKRGHSESLGEQRGAKRGHSESLYIISLH